MCGCKGNSGASSNKSCSCNKGCKGDKGEPGRVGPTGPAGPSGGVSTCAIYTAFATGGQANATPLITNDNLISVAATTGDSVKLLTAVVNTFQKVRNYGANTINIYPQSGDAIDSLGVNVPYPLAAGSIVEFVCFANGTYTT